MRRVRHKDLRRREFLLLLATAGSQLLDSWRTFDQAGLVNEGVFGRSGGHCRCVRGSFLTDWRFGSRGLIRVSLVLLCRCGVDVMLCLLCCLRAPSVCGGRIFPTLHICAFAFTCEWTTDLRRLSFLPGHSEWEWSKHARDRIQVRHAPQGNRQRDTHQTRTCA